VHISFLWGKKILSVSDKPVTEFYLRVPFREKFVGAPQGRITNNFIKNSIFRITQPKQITRFGDWTRSNV
jgi:hypothetical protein